MRLRDAKNRRCDPYDDEPRYSTFYCKASGDYAKIEVCRWRDAPTIVQRGTVVQRGSYWFNADTDRQICYYFNNLGPTMMGDNAPMLDADQIYKTQAGFDKSVSRFDDDEMLNWR